MAQRGAAGLFSIVFAPYAAVPLLQPHDRPALGDLPDLSQPSDTADAGTSAVVRTRRRVALPHELWRGASGDGGHPDPPGGMGNADDSAAAAVCGSAVCGAHRPV